MPELRAKDREFCKRLLIDLVNIRSVSGEEIRIMGYLEKVFPSLGFRPKKIPGRTGRSNLVISLGKGETVVCLNAHADTVPPSGRAQPRASIIKGRLYGLGSSDDKGPLVSAICAFKNLVRRNTTSKGRVDLFVSIGEERGGEGTDMAIRNGYRCGSAVVCESTELNIARAQSGVYFIDVETIGKAAHGSRPWQGKNAIWEMIDLVNEIEKAVRKRKRFYLIGPPSLNLGAIHGGDIPNRVPDRCNAKLDIRLMPGEDTASFKKAIEEIFRKKRWRRVSYKFIQDKGPMVTHKDDILVKAMSRAVSRVRGHSPECIGIRGWTEAGNFSRLLNVPAIIFGPGSMGCAHSQNEWIELKQVYRAARVYELFLKEVLENGSL